MPEGVRERIIKSAIELFAGKGFHETKVDEIAERSGVAKGTIYLYFSSKEDLLVNSIDYIVEKAIQNYEIDESKSFRENLADIIRKNANFMFENLNFYKMMFMSMYRVRNGDDFNKRRRDTARVTDRIRLLLQKGIEEGEVRRDMSLDNLSTIITNLILSSLMHILVKIVFDGMDSREEIENFLEDTHSFIISAVRGG
ncbi:MAG: TetR/AcrR family transcriptional regulator [Spirochaetia bacterium]|nr:TetR/AcrR family transcriptional regulator [Spirochaetota bacterium]MCX8096487.1 TetR/AcrR family transcriptional regulator [Spirochaetota bacterium]MDW8113163.1 TetR/AcrR family transcriptional regulator [Spirochaetia bacterium]